MIEHIIKTSVSSSAFYRASAVLAVPPVFVLISEPRPKALPRNGRRPGAPTKNSLFGLQLEKCYSCKLCHAALSLPHSLWVSTCITSLFSNAFIQFHFYSTSCRAS